MSIFWTFLVQLNDVFLIEKIVEKTSM